MTIDIGPGAFCAIVIVSVACIWIFCAKYLGPLIAETDKPKEK